MQLDNTPLDVELIVDLTKYDKRCKIGEKGTTIPFHKVGTFGAFDNFVAIKFDNGAIMDVAYNSLKFI